jgi:hypothetical protein
MQRTSVVNIVGIVYSGPVGRKVSADGQPRPLNPHKHAALRSPTICAATELRSVLPVPGCRLRCRHRCRQLAPETALFSVILFSRGLLSAVVGLSTTCAGSCGIPSAWRSPTTRQFGGAVLDGTGRGVTGSALGLLCDSPAAVDGMPHREISQ